MLNYQVQGEGQTIVFLHGFLESLSMWSYLDLEKIPGKHIFIDLPGHGISDLTDQNEKPSLEFMANEVLKVLSNLSIDCYSVVGHSMGGYIGLIMKSQNKRCEKLVLLNSNFWEDSEQKKKDRIRIADIVFKAKRVFIQEAIPNLFAKPELFEEEIRNLKEEALQMPPESIAYASLAMRMRKDYSEEIQLNPTDYYFIHGNLDRLIETEYLRSKLDTNQNLFVLEEAGHMAHIEQPEKVLKILQLIFQ